MATEPKCNHAFTFPGEGGGAIRFIHDLPLTLKHHYPLPALGTSEIPLFAGEFSVNRKTFKGGLALRLGPRPSLWFEGEREQHIEDIEELIGAYSLEVAHWMEDRVLSLSIGNEVPQPPGQITVTPSNSPATAWTKDQIDVAEVGRPGSLDEMTFFILNGWQAMDGATTCHEGRDHAGRLDAATGNWAIRIDPRGDVTQKAAREHMRTTAGHTVTHTGRLRREDGSTFAAAEGLKALTIIEIALSFALGRVTACVLPVAWKDGDPLWSSWGQRRAIDMPLGDGPWLDKYCATKQIAEVIERCFVTASDPTRWEAFTTALGYYIAASHDATAKMTVMLPVSGLTMLSNTLYTKILHPSDSRVSAPMLGGGKTERTVRRLMTEVGADTAVPSHLVHAKSAYDQLIARARANGSHQPVDALSAVLSMRNDVAHPELNNTQAWTTYQWGEIGFVALHMLDLALLHWIGYQGRYIPRTAAYRAADQSIRVPWASTGPDHRDASDGHRG